ncbi:MAG: ATP-binding protein [Selenomonadaceae bacterium]|nr:ATP-binding protein [Selenomonadaceae bacterium]
MENFYPERLLELKNNFSVKIISGVRGVGKTTLLEDFTERLRSEDVAAEEIIFIDCAADKRLKDFQTLYDFVAAKTSELEKFFLLLDDIDCVAECEKAINALFVGMPAEIYVTCSSEQLAEKISVLLPDNCDVLKMYPPSFAEYVKDFPSEDALQHYLHFGGLLRVFDVDKKILQALLRGTAYEIMFDIVERNSLQRAELLRLIIQTLAQNVGRPVSLNKISDGLGCSRNAFRNYLGCGEELFRKIPRFDIKTGNALIGGEKFYCVDNGILSALATVDEATLMENAVCIELLRRGYEVSCGRFGAMNVSFVAERGGEKTFIQVFDGKNSIRRSTRPLRAIDDAEKFLITLEPEKTFGDVRNVTLQEFLLTL